MSDRDIDAYLSLPPMHPDDLAPEESSADAADDFTDYADDEVEDDGSLDLSAPLQPEEDAEDSDEDGDDSEEADDDDDDRDWLIERAKKADEYERFLAHQEQKRQEQAAEAYWNERLDMANKHFAAREAAIYAEADNSLNPVGYLKHELPKLQREASQWYGEYRDNRERALWDFANRQNIPTLAARVVEHYKLPKEAVNDLLEYAPEQMEREAQKMRSRLIKERKHQKEIDQLKRKAANRKIGSTPLTTGTGRSRSAGWDKMTDEERYFATPWSRG